MRLSVRMGCKLACLTKTGEQGADLMDTIKENAAQEANAKCSLYIRSSQCYEKGALETVVLDEKVFLKTAVLSPVAKGDDLPRDKQKSVQGRILMLAAMGLPETLAH